VASLETAPTIGRDERERRRAGWRERVGNGVRSCGGQRAEPALLPRAHEPANALVVRDGGAGGGEREAAAGALAAPRHRPRGGSTTTVAERRAESRESFATGPAQLLSRGVADDAAHGQDQI
jgi:hypothetical protein